MTRVRRGAQWLGRAARRHSTSSYAEVLVSCQDTLGRQGVVIIDELLEAYGRPSARAIHEQLQQRDVYLTDAHRTELLLAYQHDLCPGWLRQRQVHSAEEQGEDEHEDDPQAPFRELHSFFKDLREAAVQNKDGQQSLFSTYLRMLLSEPSVPPAAVVALFEAALTSDRTALSAKDIMHECFAICRDVGRSEVAVDVFVLAKSHRLPIDHHTIHAFLAAAGSAGDVVLFERAVEEVESYPFLGRTLRRTPSFYGALLNAVIALPKRYGFEYVDDVMERMAENDVEANLTIYQHWLALCTVHGEEEQGERVLAEALEVNHAKEEDFDHFEAACLDFYTRFAKWEAARTAIYRADGDGKLGSVPVLLIAATHHFAKVVGNDINKGHEAVDFVARHEQAHRELGTWAEVRPACLDLYTSSGDVARAEAIFDELYLEDRTRYLPAEELRHRRHLFTLAYDKAKVRWQSNPRLRTFDPGAPVMQ
eukprot:TRINITY_DN32999_c0_g1_i1.p1 TRINITY_DN32999_c0_g1~~TRINITY_DN32999_c0_g1_i1.p1  ORF type:complete len:479 (+),score=141.67 TRINITY_DN32999_c0_g1_i1:118-1554(+)